MLAECVELGAYLRERLTGKDQRFCQGTECCRMRFSRIRKKKRIIHHKTSSMALGVGITRVSAELRSLLVHLDKGLVEPHRTGTGPASRSSRKVRGGMEGRGHAQRRQLIGQFKKSGGL